MDKQYTIEEVEAMLSVRTRGEWRAGKHAPRMVLSSDIDKTPKTTIVCQCEQSDIADAYNDAKFIAAAPAIIKQLLARVKELEAENEGLRGELGSATGYLMMGGMDNL